MKRLFRLRSFIKPYVFPIALTLIDFKTVRVGHLTDKYQIQMTR